MSRHLRRTPSVTARRRMTRARRAVALGGMLAAVGGLVTLRSTLAPTPVQALGGSSLASPVGGSAQPTHHAARRHHHRRQAGPTTQQPTHTAAPRPSRRTVTGDAFDVGYGTVQVRVTVVGKRISDVTALSLPQGGRSSDISSYAGPQLRHEALAAQSANIDTVSGASYTSAGYAKSLQSALDKAAHAS